MAQELKWDSVPTIAFPGGGNMVDDNTPTLVTCAERANITHLQSYADKSTDRRIPLLQAYLTRCRFVNEGQCASTMTVNYHTKEIYGRAFVRGAAGEKFIREARKIAFSAYTEVDATCCHLRLIRVLLKQTGIYTEERFGMIDTVCDYPLVWREALAEYLDVAVDVAKVELLEIFHGARPPLQLPFVLKLVSEVQYAVRCILATPEYSIYKLHYGDRPSPDYSRMSAILSHLEHGALMKLVTYMRLAGSSSEVLLYDGALFHMGHFANEMLVPHAIACVNSECCIPL